MAPTLTPTDTTLVAAQLAYGLYAGHLGWRAPVEGHPLPAWASLLPEEQAAWVAVVTYLRPPDAPAAP